MSAELDQLRREYERFQEKLRQQTAENPMQRVEELQQELSELTATVTSPSGTVTIVAGTGGSVRDIKLSDAAVQQPAGVLAAELKTTMQQAIAAAARQQATLVDEHTGGQLNVYDRVMQSQAEAFGTTVEDLEASLEQAAPKAPPKPARNEDDFSENTLLTKGHKPPPTAPSPPSSGGASAGDKFLKNLFGDE